MFKWTDTFYKSFTVYRIVLSKIDEKNFDVS